MITSITNNRVKMVRHLQSKRRFRIREQAFVAEGLRWLRDLDANQMVPDMLFYTESWADEPLVKACAGLCLAVSETVMAHMSDVETPSGLLMVVPMPQRLLPAESAFLLIMDRIMTPGNLGTLLRTAAAAGVDGVLLAPGCVDLYNPKVVRSSMGAHLRLPIVSAEWPQIITHTQNMKIYAAAGDAQLRYTDVDWRQRSALIVGNEADGIGDSAEKLATATIAIPMATQTESLNAAMAGGIILFEAARQQNLGGR
jgi:TrmH family RNA methyltransferase